ncbi:hypothetical protein ACWCWQ_37740 [Streptomyces sp. NPDC001571]
MTPEARKAARQAARQDAAKKHERAMARLDGVEPAKPVLDPEPVEEDEDAAAAGEAAEDQAFTHGSIPPMGADEAYAAARRALLDVTIPKDRSAKAKAAEEAALARQPPAGRSA